jgi:hypothetical protein
MSNHLVVFKSISNFISSLNECFGKDQKTLQLYARLISRTTVAHEEAIDKHIGIFKKFLNANKDAILEKSTEFEVNKISYNDRVYINMSVIFNKAENSEKDVIFQHLLNIYSQIDPESNAKKVLKDSMKKNRDAEDNGAEENFINNLIENVSKNVDENDDPLKTVNNIMQSGVFTDLLGGMSNGINSGELDLGRLMGTVQTMVTSLSNLEGDVNIPKMGGANGGGNQQPDLGNMMSQMMGMMSQMNMQEAMQDGMQNLGKNVEKNQSETLKSKLVEVEEVNDEKLTIEHTSTDDSNNSPIKKSSPSKKSSKRSSKKSKEFNEEEEVIMRKSRTIVE